MNQSKSAAISKQDMAADFSYFVHGVIGLHTYGDLWRIYCDEIPMFIQSLAQTLPMQRLKQVGMSCGCEYVALHESDMDLSHRYTRFEHSVGVALIVWHFTRDVKQSVAGLFHDISTPAFAHVVDYMNGDHMTQESTEEPTAEFIDGSDEIQRILAELGLTTADVCDYHLYPIADNDSPRLSADRLEYTCGSFLRYFVTNTEHIAKFYRDLAVETNERGESELIFRHADIAEEFACCAMECSQVYVSDTDRFTMQYLADLLKLAANLGIVTVKDLYKTEELVIDKLNSDERTAKGWREYCGIRAVQVTPERLSDRYCVSIDAKRRYIDPYVKGVGRVTQFSESYRAAVENLMDRSFNNWLSIR